MGNVSDKDMPGPALGRECSALEADLQVSLTMANLALQAKQRAYEDLASTSAKTLEARELALNNVWQKRSSVKQDARFLKAEVNKLMKDRRQMREAIARLERDNGFLLEERELLLGQLAVEGDKAELQHPHSEPQTEQQRAQPHAAPTCLESATKRALSPWRHRAAECQPAPRPLPADMRTQSAVRHSPAEPILPTRQTPAEGCAADASRHPDTLQHAEQLCCAQLQAQLLQTQAALVAQQRDHAQQQESWQDRERSLIYSLEAVLRGREGACRDVTELPHLALAERQASSCAEDRSCATDFPTDTPRCGDLAALHGSCADSQAIEDALLSTVGHFDTMPSMPTIPDIPAFPTRPMTPTKPAMPAAPTRPTRPIMPTMPAMPIWQRGAEDEHSEPGLFRHPMLLPNNGRHEQCAGEEAAALYTPFRSECAISL